MDPKNAPELTLPASRPVANGSRGVRQALAWGVHLYTALGLVCAAAIAVCVVEGSAGSFRAAFAWMLVACLIDATDGALARAASVKKVLPGFDGRRLDDIIDFLTFTFLPLFLLWRAEVLPPGWQAWLLVPLIASAYGFCQTDIKTADGYFLGFPSYWNLVAFYLYALHTYVAPLPPGMVVAVLVGLAVLTFVPTRYLYPSQRGRLNQVTCLLGGVWAVVLLVVLWRLPGGPERVPERVPERAADGLTRGLLVASLAFPVYYLGMSFVVDRRLRRSRAGAA